MNERIDDQLLVRTSLSSSSFSQFAVHSRSLGVGLEVDDAFTVLSKSACAVVRGAGVSSAGGAGLAGDRGRMAFQTLSSASSVIPPSGAPSLSLLAPSLSPRVPSLSLFVT